MQYQDMIPLAVFHSIPNMKKKKKKNDDDMIDFVEFPSLSLESPSVVTSVQYICYLYEENKSVSNVNELRYRMLECLPK